MQAKSSLKILLHNDIAMEFTWEITRDIKMGQ